MVLDRPPSHSDPSTPSDSTLTAISALDDSAPEVSDFDELESQKGQDLMLTAEPMLELPTALSSPLSEPVSPPGLRLARESPENGKSNAGANSAGPSSPELYLPTPSQEANYLAAFALHSDSGPSETDLDGSGTEIESDDEPGPTDDAPLAEPTSSSGSLPPTVNSSPLEALAARTTRSGKRARESSPQISSLDPLALPSQNWAPPPPPRATSAQAPPPSKPAPKRVRFAATPLPSPSTSSESHEDSSSKKRRSARSNASFSPSNATANLSTKPLAHYGVLITNSPSTNSIAMMDPKVVSKLVEKMGGTVVQLSDVFSVVQSENGRVELDFHLREMEKQGIERLVLLAEEPKSTIKYRVALALGIPCFSWKALEYWKTKTEPVHLATFALAAGHSETVGAAILGPQAKAITPDWNTPTMLKLRYESSDGFFADLDFLLVIAQTPDAADRQDAFRTMLASASANRVVFRSDVPGADDATEFDFVIVDEDVPVPKELSRVAKVRDLKWFREAFVRGIFA